MKTKLCFVMALAGLPALAAAQNLFPPTGNVGIGTLTPASTLDVNGSVRLGPTRIEKGDLILDSNYGIFSPGNLYFQTFGTMYLNGLTGQGDVLVGGPEGTNTFVVRGTASLGRTHISQADLSLDSNYGIFSPGNLYLETTGTLFLNALPGQGNVQIGGNGAAGNLGVTGTVTAGGGFKFANGSVLTSASLGGDLSGSLSSAAIRNGAVTATKIADLAVGATKLSDLAVTSTKIADGAVNTPKIADGSVTDAKIVSLSWSKIVGQPPSSPIMGPAGGHLAGTYPNPTIAAGVVGSTQLASDAASLAKVSGGALSAANGVDAKGSLSLKSSSGVLRVKLQDINGGGGWAFIVRTTHPSPFPISPTSQEIQSVDLFP